ncbi:hypothetical protein, partial [Planktomarina sp.]|uniref:hypothetical protein n=1 Tax=Planktomarina sp. TaxID=2024851 RepID=UPI0032606260
MQDTVSEWFFSQSSARYKMRGGATENGFHEPREMSLVFRFDRRHGQLTGRRNPVTESNAMTQAQAKTLDEGRPLSRPHVACIALNRHPFSFGFLSGGPLSDASGYNGKKDAYRCH